MIANSFCQLLKVTIFLDTIFTMLTFGLNVAAADKTKATSKRGRSLQSGGP